MHSAITKEGAQCDGSGAHMLTHVGECPQSSVFGIVAGQQAQINTRPKDPTAWSSRSLCGLAKTVRLVPVLSMAFPARDRRRWPP